MAGGRTPVFRLSIDGEDLTAAVRPRLESLTLKEERDHKADQLDLVLTDHDGRMAIPKKGALISLSLGWKDKGLIDKGRFMVDETGHSGSPDKITVRARSADFTGALRVRQHRTWRDTTLGAVLRDVAGGRGLQAKVDPALAAQPVAVLDQGRESDAALLRRLGRQYDAVSTIKKGVLIFTPKGRATTPGGRALAAIAITRADGDQHNYQTKSRDEYTGVTAHWHDVKGARRRKVTVGGADKAKVLKRTHASEHHARRAASAEHGRLQRGEATMSYTLALGRPELAPETPVRISGLKAEIDAITWVATSVTHTLNDGGLTTQVEMEKSA